MPTRRRVPTTSSRPRPKGRKSAATADGTPAIRPRRDPLAREWVPLPTSARAIGFDWRTIRKHIAGEPFVRVLGGRWYVRHAELVAWWERQRPPVRRPARSAR
jgi:hypothetical protein